MDLKIWPNYQEVKIYSMAAIYCHSHDPPLWYFKGKKLNYTNNTLFFNSLSWEDSGVYLCQGKEFFGAPPFKVRSEIIVTVRYNTQWLRWQPITPRGSGLNGALLIRNTSHITYFTIVETEQ